MDKNKEQIIIDGCNVSGCENYRPKDRFTCYPYICNCHQKPDCSYKQLKRKEQECEELKAYAQRQENQREEYYKEFLKKDKALEEIKKICKFNLYQSIVRQSVDSSMSCLNKIRDIISKAKGEE